MEARSRQETPTNHQINAALYFTHPVQHSGIKLAIQRGPGWWAEEIERVAAAYLAGKTPEQVESERQAEAWDAGRASR
jgi:hypothetical protein